MCGCSDEWLIKEILALWLVKDCMTSWWNHLVQHDYSREGKFRNGSFMLWGSNNHKVWGNTFHKYWYDTFMKFLLIKLIKPAKFWWKVAAYLSTSNQNNWNETCTKLPLFPECFKKRNKFKTEFESTWACNYTPQAQWSLLNSHLNFMWIIVK